MSLPDTVQEAPSPRSGWAPLRSLRKHAAVLVTLLLFCAGLYALDRLLAPLDMRAVMASIRATPPQIYMLAIGATAVGYAALIGYDWTATRYIGKRVPLPSIALGGFLGYAFGNTIGLSALSGGAVRYRIYTALGLSGYDVAAISGFTAVAYGVGATLIGLAALTLHPGALAGITSVPPDTIRPLALIVVGAALAFIVYVSVRRSSLRISRFELRSPSFRNVLCQMAFSVIDMTAASFALYVLLPPGAMSFTTFLPVFAVATMVGVASHVPGGVGVFESVIIAALGSSVPVSDAVTGLLLFRLIYFLLPFLLAVVVLSLSEIWTATGRSSKAYAVLAPVLQAGQSIIPLVMGVLVLGSGLFMMFSGLLRHPPLGADQIEHILPLVMIEGGAMLSSIVGSALVVLALGIFRRSRAAFWLVLAALGVGIVAALLHGNDMDRAMVLVLMALLLWPCRREFYREALLSQGVLSGRWIVFALAIAASICVTYIVVHRSASYSGALWWQFSLEDDGPRAQRAALTGSVFLMLTLLFAAMKTRALRPLGSDPETLARARSIIAAHGTAADLLALTGGKLLIFSESGGAVLSYGVRGGSWIALGAPVGAPEDCEGLAWSFHDGARAAGARPVFYAAPEGFQRQSVEMGLAVHLMGEEAVLRLGEFSLEGPERARLRAARARGLRAGLSVEILTGALSEPVMEELRAISDAWLAARGGRERRFALGSFDPEYLRRFPVAVVRQGGEIIGFANLPMVEAGRAAAIDMLRHRPDARSGAMEFLVLNVAGELAARGYRELSLGMAPVAGLGPRAEGADIWARYAALVHRRGERASGFAGMRSFMDKFRPEWRPRYLCCRSVLLPRAILADAALLIAGSSRTSAGSKVGK